MPPQGVRALRLLDLPREIRDKIYEYSRTFSWIDIANMPKEIHQPSITKVSHQIRDEALDVFYGRNRFMLDLRNHIHSSYHPLTPPQILTRWITAIGDANTSRLRILSFYVYNFAVHFTILPPSPSQPMSISLRFKQTRSSMDVADDAGPAYSAKLAVWRAEAYLQNAVQMLVQEIGGRGLVADDVLRLENFVEDVKPALCTRNGVGWKGAILTGDVRKQPEVRKHLEACAECRYVGRPLNS
ncbi:uncharacterized protein RCC_08036 [Ramularia collo-cygni]|uniref:F-box domain-containing protein n=1 Tax=Ramularia collo-cygni TaxID=112498 RepID=A0A2D3VBI2_9PEZI|nr:uncharacterized protein RCC_08036 [Ramularia collo-cygni]CZT22167.1 uncharacterized protein RCC_08036 [Ramularia collo-cygni]